MSFAFVFPGFMPPGVAFDSKKNASASILTSGSGQWALRGADLS
jgi:hypothetical protein